MLSRTFKMRYALSRMERETRSEFPSRRYRLISPRIIGTAYVENLTLNERSNPSIALISPTQPA